MPVAAGREAKPRPPSERQPLDYRRACSNVKRSSTADASLSSLRTWKQAHDSGSTMRDRSISTAVGRLLQQRRLNSRIPLPRLAKKVGLSVSALQRIEEGGTRPSLGTLNDLARHLATSVPELVRKAKLAQAAPANTQNVLSIGP